MSDNVRAPRFRPPSLSLVTVTSLEKNRLIFNLTNRYRTKTLGFTQNESFDNFYDSNSIGTPTIVIDPVSDSDNSDRRSTEQEQSLSEIIIDPAKFLCPPPPRRRRHVSESDSVSSLSSITSKKSNRSAESVSSSKSSFRSSIKSRNSTRDDDNISIGGCSISPDDEHMSIDPKYDHDNLNKQLINFLSVMYALVLIVIGGIICVINLDSEVRIVNKIFIIIVTLIGFIWTAFLHWDIHRYKLFAIEYLYNTDTTKQTNNFDHFEDDISITTAVLFNTINRKPTPDNSTLPNRSSIHSAYRFLHGKHSGNFYLKCGMTVFCFGSIVHMGVEICNQIYFFTDDDTKCQDGLRIVVLIIKSVYSFYSLFIVFKYSNIVINRFTTIAKFALMHLLGTSISIWFDTIINEAIDDYVHTVHTTNGTYNTTDGELFEESVQHLVYCLDKSIVSKNSMDALPYLYPFTIEFNIILASVWYTVWTNIGKINSNAYFLSLRREITEDASGKEEISLHSTITISADCTASNRGLFSGLCTLLATFITIVVFFTTIQKTNYSHVGDGIYLTQIGLLTIISCAVIPLAYRQTRKLNVVRHHMNNSSTAMDDLLVLVPVPFFLLHYVLLIGAYMDNPTFDYTFLIIIHIMTIIQVLIQSPFIVDGIRRCANSKKLRFLKPGRGLVTYALILNIALWILNTFELKSVDRYHGMENYYGTMSWMIISHITLPLMLFYRFHSSVCLSDIWKYAYEKD